MDAWHMVCSGDYDVRATHRKDRSREILCPLDSAHVAMARNYATPLTFELSAPYPDFIGFAGDWLVSNRVRIALEASDLRGFGFRSAVCWGTTLGGVESLEYSELQVEGWGGIVNPKSGMRLTAHCDSCGVNIFSALENCDVLDSRRWDGSDTYLLYPLGRFVSARFKEWVEANMYTGVRFEPIGDYVEMVRRNPPLANPGVAGVRYWGIDKKKLEFDGADEVW